MSKDIASLSDDLSDEITSNILQIAAAVGLGWLGYTVVKKEIKSGIRWNDRRRRDEIRPRPRFLQRGRR